MNVRRKYFSAYGSAAGDFGPVWSSQILSTSSIDVQAAYTDGIYNE